MQEVNNMLTTQQAAHALGITPALLRQWVKRGKIPKPTKFGRDWMFSAEEIETIKNMPRNKAGRPKGNRNEKNDTENKITLLP